MAGYISSFTITVVCVILLSFILRAMMPRSGLEKYVNFVIGIIVTITLVGSFLGVPHLDFDEIVSADTSSALTKENAATLYNEKVAESFRTNLEKSVNEYVENVYSTSCETDVMLRMGTDGKVEAIDGVYVTVSGSVDAGALRQDVTKQFGLEADVVHIAGAAVLGGD